MESTTFISEFSLECRHPIRLIIALIDLAMLPIKVLTALHYILRVKGNSEHPSLSGPSQDCEKIAEFEENCKHFQTIPSGLANTLKISGLCRQNNVDFDHFTQTFNILLP